MSVVAAAAVGPSPVAPSSSPYGMCGGGVGGGGARKRKDVVQQLGDLAPGGVDDEDNGGVVHGLFVLETVEEEREEEEEEEKSSIGVDSEEEEDDGEEEEVDSKAAAAAETWRRKTTTKKCGGGGALSCLDALDDALPIKRGLSNFFSGKSRSFANLQDAASGGANVLAKPENPFNKRRRILRCPTIRRVSSTSLTALPPFLPPQPPPDDGVNTRDGSG